MALKPGQFVREIVLRLPVLVSLSMAAAQVWGQPSDVFLNIDPVSPDSNSAIRFTVNNSPCYYGGVNVEPEFMRIEVSVSRAIKSLMQDCLEQNPEAPDFTAEIDPLKAGSYVVSLTEHIGGFLVNLVETRTLLVEQAAPGLPEGGINGLYYNPKSDGHYVNIIQFNGGTVILWNTFDVNGNQALVTAVGELNEADSTMLEVPAYITLDGRVSLEGNFEPANVEPWGTLSLIMDDCHGGLLRFASDREDFVSGEWQLERLTRIKQIGCANPVR